MSDSKQIPDDIQFAKERHNDDAQIWRLPNPDVDSTTFHYSKSPITHRFQMHSQHFGCEVQHVDLRVDLPLWLFFIYYVCFVRDHFTYILLKVKPHYLLQGNILLLVTQTSLYFFKKLTNQIFILKSIQLVGMLILVTMAAHTPY